MHVVMGATGNFGSAVANALLRRSEAVTICARHPEAAQDWRATGASVAMADAEDFRSLKAAFQCDLNPPVDPSGDSDATELVAFKDKRHWLQFVVCPVRHRRREAPHQPRQAMTWMPAACKQP